MDLMTEAVWRRFLPPEIRFSGLQEYYGVLVIGFGWPEISQKTLSMLLVAHGAERLERRKRVNGKDTRRVVFRFPDFQERAAA